MSCSSNPGRRRRQPFFPARIRLLPNLILLSLAAAGCRPEGRAPAGGPELIVFAAASLTEALEEVGRLHHSRSGVRPIFNFAGSNVLALQILASARADVFVSASPAWMDRLQEAGRIRDGTRIEPWTNSLVLVGHPAATWSPRQDSELCAAGFRYLALGNPEAVPAGRYAREWLSSRPCPGGNLWQVLADRVSPTPDVRAALSQVEARRDVVGIVYRTDAAAVGDRVKLLLEIRDSPSIRYSAARLDAAPNPGQADAFLALLRTPAAGRILGEHGFGVLEEGARRGPEP